MPQYFLEQLVVGLLEQIYQKCIRSRLAKARQAKTGQ
jgi:hypothetical protein